MADVETSLRGPDAYRLARRAVDLMERHQVWPTALNFELWTHYVADPEGALARELTRLIAMGEPMTELVCEELAATYLPKARLNEQIRDAGDLLSKELESVSKAIQNAQKSNTAFGKHLAGVSKELNTQGDVEAIKAVVSNLADATRRVHKENQSLESGSPTRPPKSIACASIWSRSVATQRPTVLPILPIARRLTMNSIGPARKLMKPDRQSAWPFWTSITSRVSTTHGATRLVTR